MRTAFVAGVLLTLPFVVSSEIAVADFRNTIGTLRQNVEVKHRRWGVISEPLSFDVMSRSVAYRNFAASISNDWSYAVTHLSQLATNQWERLVTIGVGKTYDEDFYLSACTRLADLEQAGSITRKELLFMLSSSRTNIDMCVVSRYREPAVTNLVEKLRRVIPDDTYWDSVLSGEAYLDRISKNHNEF